MSVNNDAFTCSRCGFLVWSGTVHTCAGLSNLPPSEMTARMASATLWNGPVCHVCNQGYIGVHECDLEPIPCPDARPGCQVAHYGHKKR